MQVDPAQRENLEERLPEDLPVRCHDKEVGSQSAHLLDEGGIKTRGLEQPESEGKSRFFDRGRHAYAPAA